MTMEAYVLCDRAPDGFPDWQRAIEALDFGLTLQPSRELVRHQGHLPATWRGREVGFEVNPFTFADLTETYDDVDFVRPWPCVYAFYFSSLSGCVGAWMAIAAWVRMNGGMAYDPQADRLLTAEEAVRYARAGIDSFDETMAELNAAMAGSTGSTGRADT
ncbi:hypothetical protein [Methylobacterium gregans]|uniref:Uncharacterized protein n=1 Tax=Methylobacterium gregans TaxID=374424 RepID=A0AA37HM59_9HYPH|nr:hypothetical protein [Methylobacterium gregans]MDQ0520771.1 hypothetical protein [Methylobacterium gregans]GJD78334.1 hypothetical protein NBEOAGPD_1548 [Methylobacterium gregans]